MIQRISLSILALAAAISLHANAQTEELNVEPQAAGAYTCQLSGTMKGGSVAIIVGGQIVKGTGQIDCVDNRTGQRVSREVTLRMAGGGVGFELAKIRALRVVSAGIAVNDPSYFFDNFSLGADAGLSLVRAGIGFDAAVKLTGHRGFGFQLGFQGKDILGLGAHLYGMAFRIQPR